MKPKSVRKRHELFPIKIMTNNGVVFSPAIMFFEYLGRKYAIVNNTYTESKYSVTDYSTGLAVCFGNNKSTIIRLAKDKLNTVGAKVYNYSKHEIINL